MVLNASDTKVKRVIFLLTAILTNLFSYAYSLGNAFQYLHYIISFIILFYYLKGRRYLNKDIPLRSIVLCLCLYPIFSFYFTLFLYNPECWDYYKYRVISQAIFLIFFLFHIYKVKENALMQAFVTIGLIVFAIQIVQQILPDYAIFGVRDVSDINNEGYEKVEIRNGLYRYRLISVYFITMLNVFYFWEKILIKRTRKDILFFCIFLCSTYLFLTRQIIFSVGISILISFLFTRNSKAKRWSIYGAVLLAILLYFFYDTIFGELMSKTQDELDDSNIRLTCLAFYWEKITKSFQTILLGNGFPALLVEWQRGLKLTPADIGLVGEWFYYGIIWIIIYLYTLGVIFMRYRDIIPLYIKLFLISTFLISIMIFPYRSAIEYLIWSSVLYICSIHIKKFKLKKHINNERIACNSSDL